MIEYINISHREGWSFCELKLEFVNGEIKHDFSTSGFALPEKGRPAISIESFMEAVEKTNIYALKNEYVFEDVVIEDGLSYSIQYKEEGKPEKTINGEYYPDELIELFSEIELLIPEAVFFSETEFDEWLEDMEFQNAPKEITDRLRDDFYALPTWAKRDRFLENAIALLEEYER